MAAVVFVAAAAAAVVPVPVVAVAAAAVVAVSLRSRNRFCRKANIRRDWTFVQFVLLLYIHVSCIPIGQGFLTCIQ